MIRESVARRPDVRRKTMDFLSSFRFFCEVHKAWLLHSGTLRSTPHERRDSEWSS